MTDNTIPVQTSPTPSPELPAQVEETSDTTAGFSDPPAAEDAPPAPAGFSELGLHPDVSQALDDMGYFEPTPVQRAVFEPVTAGKDLLVQSRTGTGKTTAFGLPIVNRIVPAVQKPQAMVLCPTRELALQVARELTQIGKHRGVIVEAVYGGAPIAKQIAALKNGVHIIVGTPGRVLDHIGRRTLDCSTLATFVLDECDEMLSMGFLEDIERVTANLPEKHQTLLFSATMPDEVARYARRHMKAAETMSLSRDSVSVADIHHAYYIVSGIARSRDLLKIIYAEEPESAIIFCNLRDETTTVAKFLNKQGLDAEPLSSDLSQADRERVMNRMKAKNLRFLCATDVAARGIDISNLSHVINFSVPEQPEVYVHRTGRTGRAGKKGTALSLVGPRELGNFRYIRLQFGIRPEERLLPKDEIFVGRLKVPLPPVGAPQPPDPVQILIRGVPQTPTDLERQIFEKLLATANGKRVLAQLVAEKLNALSTRTAPRNRSSEADRAEKPWSRRADSDAESGSDRSQFRDATQRIEREPGERSERRDRRPQGSSGISAVRSLIESTTSDRDRNHESSRESTGRERPRFDRESRNDRGRPDRRRFDDDTANARSDRDRGEPRGNRDRAERNRSDHPRTESNRHRQRDAAPTEATPNSGLEFVANAIADASLEEANERHYTTSNGRHARGDTIVEAVTRGAVDHDVLDTISPTVPSSSPPAEPRDTIQPDRTAKRSREKPASESSEATREFWETWADTKTATVPPPPLPAKTDDGATATAEPSRGSRTARSGRGSRGGHKSDDAAKALAKDSKRIAKKTEASASVEPSKKHEGGRGKHDTLVTTDDAQARLFINLGKKHGVSADDLRTLLAGPLGGDRARIGSVSLRDSHAHVRVPEDVVDAIITSINGTQHNEHDVTVERSRG